MLLSITKVVTAFGRHRFALIKREELQVIELQIMVDSTLLISERMLELVGKAVARMIPNLKFALAVEQDGGRVKGRAAAAPKGSLVIISGPGGLQDRLEQDAAEVSVGPAQKWEGTRAQSHFKVWLQPSGLRKGGYDVFFSYRWNQNDVELVISAITKLRVEMHGDRQMHVFLDRECLQAGRRFDKDFLEALFMSTVVVPVVSMEALKRMMTLNKDSEDNVLLEWTLICELVEIGHLEYCLPILIGTVHEDSVTEAMEEPGP
jgi:hypothetical protein